MKLNILIALMLVAVASVFSSASMAVVGKCSTSLALSSWQMDVDSAQQVRALKVWNYSFESVANITTLSEKTDFLDVRTKAYHVIQMGRLYKGKVAINVDYDDRGNITGIQLVGLDRGLFKIQFFKQADHVDNVFVDAIGEPKGITEAQEALVFEVEGE